MNGSELIKKIQEAHLEDYDFCITDVDCNTVKRKAMTITSFEYAIKNHNGLSYTTGRKLGNSKIATLTIKGI